MFLFISFFEQLTTNHDHNIAGFKRFINKNGRFELGLMGTKNRIYRQVI